ncbi:hypothetical protein Tco_0444802 [Tanacetum coccineum]
MTKLAFCDYHNMVAILEKTEHNTDFHHIVDFLEASHIRIETTDGGTKIIAKCISPKSTGFNEFSSNIATAIVCLATNRTYNFSKMILDGMIRNVKSKGTKFLMYPRFIEKCLKMGHFGVIKHTETYHVPFHTQKVFTTLRVNSPSFSGRIVPLFDYMLVPQGEGSENPTEPHHTPSPQIASPPQEEQTTSPESIPHETTIHTTSQDPIPQQITTPSQAPFDISTPRRLTRGAIWISQSKAPTPEADETASPSRDVRHGEAFPTATSLDAGQDRENIAKTYVMPHESSPRVTSLGGGEGSMQQKLNELMDFCTSLQRQHSQMAEKIKRGCSKHGGIDQGEDFLKGDAEKDSSKSTKKGSGSSGVMANVLGTLEAINILASGGLKSVFTTASPSVAPASETVSPAVATANEKDPTAAVSTTTKDQRIREQAARDAEIARIQAEEELKIMIDELNRSNEIVAKHMSEYEQAADVLSLEEKIELITELIKYQRDLAQIKKYQAQQSKLASKTERRKFYTISVKKNAGWECKDFKWDEL